MPTRFSLRWSRRRTGTCGASRSPLVDCTAASSPRPSEHSLAGAPLHRANASTRVSRYKDTLALIHLPIKLTKRTEGAPYLPSRPLAAPVGSGAIAKTQHPRAALTFVGAAARGHGQQVVRREVDSRPPRGVAGGSCPANAIWPCPRTVRDSRPSGNPTVQRASSVRAGRNSPRHLSTLSRQACHATQGIGFKRASRTAPSARQTPGFAATTDGKLGDLEPAASSSNIEPDELEPDSSTCDARLTQLNIIRHASRAGSRRVQSWRNLRAALTADSPGQMGWQGLTS